MPLAAAIEHPAADLGPNPVLWLHPFVAQRLESAMIRASWDYVAQPDFRRDGRLVPDLDDLRAVACAVGAAFTFNGNAGRSGEHPVETCGPSAVLGGDSGPE